jgi:hypothetical protein
MRPIENILSKVDKPHQRSNGQWSAHCPAHSDKSPSLSIRETDEGAVLIHCFAGCSVQSIVESLGLNQSDLFPPRLLSGKEPKRTPRLITSSQALEILHDEANFVAITAMNIANQKKLTLDDISRCAKSAARIAVIRDEAVGRKNV